jgi:hypothetical protein
LPFLTAFHDLSIAAQFAAFVWSHPHLPWPAERVRSTIRCRFLDTGPGIASIPTRSMHLNPIKKIGNILK